MYLPTFCTPQREATSCVFTILGGSIIKQCLLVCLTIGSVILLQDCTLLLTMYTVSCIIISLNAVIIGIQYVPSDIEKASLWLRDTLIAGPTLIVGTKQIGGYLYYGLCTQCAQAIGPIDLIGTSYCYVVLLALYMRKINHYTTSQAICFQALLRICYYEFMRFIGNITSDLPPDVTWPIACTKNGNHINCIFFLIFTTAFLVSVPYFRNLVRDKLYTIPLNNVILYKLQNHHNNITASTIFTTSVPSSIASSDDYSCPFPPLSPNNDNNSDFKQWQTSVRYISLRLGKKASQHTYVALHLLSKRNYFLNLPKDTQKHIARCCVPLYAKQFEEDYKRKLNLYLESITELQQLT